MLRTKPNPWRHPKRRLRVERLEPRINLAHGHAVLPPSELSIVGTEGADQIELKYDAAANSMVVTRNRETVGVWSIGDWASVRIQSQQGDDHIYVDPNLPLSVTVDGGDGSDTVSGIEMGSSQNMLLSNGERLAFHNRVCAAVECIRSEGEMIAADTVDHFAESSHDFASLAGELTLTAQSHSHLGTPEFESTTTFSANQHDHAALAITMATSGSGIAADSTHGHGPQTMVSTSVTYNGESTGSTTASQRSAISTELFGGVKLRKVCLITGTTIDNRLETSTAVVRDVTPLKPGCT